MPQSRALESAPVLSRGLAGLVDLLVLGTIDAAILYFTLRVVDLPLADIWSLPAVPFGVFLLLLNGGYLAIFTAAGGQTIGKMLAGIKVVADRPAARSRVRPRRAADQPRRFGAPCDGLSRVAATRRRWVRGDSLRPGRTRAARSPRRDACREGVTRIAVFLATAGYSGYFPIAPGTVGSAVGLLVYGSPGWSSPPVPAVVEVLLILCLFAAGVWAATTAERYFGGIDPGPIVIDEVVGMLITLAFIPVAARGAFAGSSSFASSMSSSHFRRVDSRRCTAAWA